MAAIQIAIKFTNIDMQTLWLIRHADRLDFIQPEWFETALCPYDSPLAAIGFDRAASLAHELSQAPVGQIFASPFLRTIQTAAPLARLLELSIQLEWGLCEWLCQDWTTAFPATMPIDELIMDYPINQGYQSLVLPSYPETAVEMQKRTKIIAHKLVQSTAENILVIAHKGSILGIAAALTENNGWLTQELPCGERIELVRDGDIWREVG